MPEVTRGTGTKSTRVLGPSRPPVVVWDVTRTQLEKESQEIFSVRTEWEGGWLERVLENLGLLV